MKCYLFVFIISVCLLSGIRGSGQPCITAANPFVAGYCNNDSIPCDQKNANKKADYQTDLYDFKLVNISEYATPQAFGRVGNNPEDQEVLSCRLYLPENNHILRPVILFSSLSSFTSSKVIGSLQNYFCSYFAKKGFVVVIYESRKFFVDRSMIDSSSTLTDFITNPYYTSDTTVLNDFIDFRDNKPTQDYKFADLLTSLSKGVNGNQLAHDAYLEMIYKVTYDTKHLLQLLAQNQNVLDINSQAAFLAGGSAAAVQSMHAGFLEHPDQMDSILDTVAMTYRGLSYPAPGNLSDDFIYEPDLTQNIRPLGVVNFWGFITSLDIIDSNDPSIFNAHGTWDHIFSYQLTFQEQMQKWFGYGAEAIFHKAKTEDLHTDLFSVCRGKHALYPGIVNCGFKRKHEGDLFKDLLQKVNMFIIENGVKNPHDDIYALNLPANYSSVTPPVTLQPSPQNLLSNPGDHCPLIYPDHFNVGLFQGNPNTSGSPSQQAKMQIEIAENEESIDMFAYPNPFSEDVILDILLDSPAAVDVVIYNLENKVISVPYAGYKLDSGLHKLDLKIDGVSPGTYIVKTSLTGGMSRTLKIIKH